MAKENTNPYYERPPQPQVTGYTSEPKYVKHQYYEDKLAILVCQIKIWKPEVPKWFDIPAADQCLTVRECESVEISDSAKELIGKAVVRFPRGTVISRSAQKDKKVTTGGGEGATKNTDTLENATNNGDVITTQSSTLSEDSSKGLSVTSMAVNYDDKGLLDFNRTKDEPALLSPNDVAVGNRIEIRLGYAYSETEFREMNSTDNHKYMAVAFTGFITSVSVGTPLELECTNMAHVLSCISSPNVSLKHTFNVKDFLDDGSKYELLKDTGISLAEHCKGSELTVTGSSLTDNLNISDVLSRWEESGVLCMMETSDDGSAQLKVGLTYYAGSGADLPTGDKKYITYKKDGNTVTLIQFDYDVAQDKLEAKQVDKKYLAVEAIGRVEGKFFKLTVRKNPDEDDGGWMMNDGDFQIVNSREVLDRKKIKVIDGAASAKRIEGRLKNPVDMKKYVVVPYQSIKPSITEKELIEEAKQFWAKYNPNGLSGSITIFGDLVVRPTDIVGLIDPRQPEKNGYYYVESVNTTFGVNGYRRELKMPYKVASFSKPVETI